MARTSCFMLRTTPRTLVSKVAAKLSAVWSVIGPTAPSVAALLTATSRRPNRATVLSTMLRTSSSLRTSALMNSASAPRERSSLTSSLPASSRRPATTTFAPFLAKATAAARPIPVSPPVTNTIGVLMIDSLISLRAEPQKPLPRRSVSTHRRPPVALVVKDLGTHCAAEKDFLGLAPYLVGMRQGLELRHLRYFVAVAEEGSLTVAAERRLHTAQPSLSRQIRDLEHEIGGAMLVRSARGIDLTDSGRAFLDHARLALVQVEAAIEAARGAARKTRLRARFSHRPGTGVDAGSHAHPPR